MVQKQNDTLDYSNIPRCRTTDVLSISYIIKREILIDFGQLQIMFSYPSGFLSTLTDCKCILLKKYSYLFDSSVEIQFFSEQCFCFVLIDSSMYKKSAETHTDLFNFRRKILLISALWFRRVTLAGGTDE